MSLLWTYIKFYAKIIYVMDKKFLIVITGKSGVGKSVFSKILANELDCLLLNLDNISHLSLEDNEIKSKLKTNFGEEIFDGDKILRKKLGKIVFNNPEKLNFLNSISQIFMEDYIDNFIKNSNKKFIILEYALLTKMKYFNDSDYKILIYADKQTRFDRLIKRDNVTEDYLNLREKNLPDFDKSNFDECIDNSISKNQDLYEIAKNIAKKIQTPTN